VFSNFLNALTSREGNLDSFLLLFLIFCLVYKKQIDPNDIGKVRKNFNVKNGKQKKNNGAMSHFEQRKASH